MIKKTRGQVPSLWTRDFFNICLLNLFVGSIGYMLITAFPFYLVDLGGNEITVGIATACYSLAALVMRPIAGRLLDYHSRKAILFIGLAGVTLILLFYLLIPVLGVALVLRALHGFLWSGISTASSTNVCDILEPARFGEGMSFFGLTNSLGMALAPGIGVWLVAEYGFGWLFVACMACGAAALPLAMSFPFRKITLFPMPEGQGIWQRAGGLFSREALPASVVQMLSIVPNGAVMSFIALYSAQAGVGNGGLFFMLSAIASILFRTGGARLADRHGEGIAVYIGNAAYVASLLLITYSGSIALFCLAGVFFGVGLGSTMPALQAMAMRSVPISRRGAAAGTYYSALDIGVSVGGLIGGFFSTLAGYRRMFLLLSLGAVASVALYLAWARHTPAAFRNYQAPPAIQRAKP